MRPAAFVAAALIALGLAGWLRSRADSAPPATPAPAAAPRPAPKASAEPAATAPVAQAPPVPQAAPAAAAEARSMEDLLARIAPAELLKRRPDLPAKLAALLDQHPEDDEWEAGAVAYLLHDLSGMEALEAWKRAAELLPGNGLVADACLRAACEQSGPLQEDLIRTLSGRDPSWALPRWLLASARMESGDAEGAEKLLLEAASLPPCPERSGLAERGGLRVREALDGAIPPPEVFGALYGIRLSPLSRLNALARGLDSAAKDLDARGAPERAQALLEAGLAMGRSQTDGSRFLISYLVGTSHESRALQALEERARSSGDLAAGEELAARLRSVQDRRGQTRRWMEESQAPVQRRLQEISERGDGRTDLFKDWTGVQFLLTQEDRAFLEDLTRQHMAASEMHAYRAWLALQPRER